jgi:bifunctional ADP-heptose synthase (sugar kinase/adenylyltransferase)
MGRFLEGMEAMKTNKTLIKELRVELRYHQQLLRVDIRAVKAGIAKCKEIGAKMRELQKGIK